ncbi:methyltransferase family protein [Hydrogenophaga atypica]|uniref:Methyltransferase family protein n=1 Tax=Hydrogenophaga atypica TaxID=249409 RepID=A0ABW2QJA0_9BURK
MLGQLWVTLQFGLLLVLATLCLLEARQSVPSSWSWVLWSSSAVLGLWTLWVNRPGNFNIRPEPREGGQLVQEGPYRWVRHPMYGAVLLLAAGAGAWLANATALALWTALLAVLIAKSKLEEQWLLGHYPLYADYRHRTWRLLPWIY